MASEYSQGGIKAQRASLEDMASDWTVALYRLALAPVQALWLVADWTSPVSYAHRCLRRGHNLLQAVSRYKRYVRYAFKSMIHHTPAPARPPTHILHPYHPYATYASLFPHAHLTHTLPSTHPHHILGPPSHYTMTSYIFVPSLSQ